VVSSSMEGALNANIDVIRASQFQTWIDWYYSRLPIPLFATAILSGLSAYLVGLGLSCFYAFRKCMLRLYQFTWERLV
jgi:hypothetical protein